MPVQQQKGRAAGKGSLQSNAHPSSGNNHNLAKRTHATALDSGVMRLKSLDQGSTPIPNMTTAKAKRQ